MRTLSKTVKIGVAICAILVAYMGYAKIRLATCTADRSDMIRLTRKAALHDEYGGVILGFRNVRDNIPLEKQFPNCCEIVRFKELHEKNRVRYSDNPFYDKYIASIPYYGVRIYGPNQGYVAKFDKCGSMIDSGMIGG